MTACVRAMIVLLAVNPAFAEPIVEVVPSGHGTYDI